MMADQWLFSYGTLRQPEVQRALFGRTLESVADWLPGYRIETLRIEDAEVIRLSGSDRHPVLRRGRADERVEGLALALGDDDLLKADAYEVSDYVRVAVTLGSGKAAFVYLHRDDVQPPAFLSTPPR